MINESSLRAKIRSLIEAEMKNMADEKNEPANKEENHKDGCGCEDCANKRKILKARGNLNIQGLSEQVEKEIVPLKEWRNMELNSLLLNRFGIVSPQVLGEKRFANDPKLDKDGDGKPKWADKDDNDPEVGKRSDRKVSDKVVKKAHKIGKEVEKSGSAEEPYAVGMAMAKKLSKKKGK